MGGANRPERGEIVVYHQTAETSVFARIVDVTFWDLVDLEVDGVVIAGVRRYVPAIDLAGEELGDRVGRFERLIPMRTI